MALTQGKRHAKTEPVCSIWSRVHPVRGDRLQRPAGAAATGGRARREAADGLDRTSAADSRAGATRLYTEVDARNAKPPARFEVKAPKGAPNVVIVLIDDIGFGGTQHRSAARSARRRWTGWPRRWPALQQVPHHGALLADAQGAEDRPQPSRQHRLHHGDGHGISGQHRAEPEERRAAGGDAAPEWLQHRRLRQVARDGGLGRPASRARSIAGRRIRASTSSTGSSAARPTSGIRSSTTVSQGRAAARWRTTTSPWT